MGVRRYLQHNSCIMSRVIMQFWLGFNVFISLEIVHNSCRAKPSFYEDCIQYHDLT
jgi:hypothetical protein